MDDAASRLAELEEDDVGADRSDESDDVARAVPRDVRGSEEVNLADADGLGVDKVFVEASLNSHSAFFFASS